MDTKPLTRIETDEDLDRGLRNLVQIDPTLGPVLEDLDPIPLRRRADGFGAILSAIVGQQVSTASAAAIWGRLEAAGLTDPAAVRADTGPGLAACGLSRPKIRYASALAASDLDYVALRLADTDTVVARLIKEPGIGRWTAEVYALVNLGHADVFPAGDLALQEAARLFLNLKDRPNEAAMREIATRWAPLRAVAARILWAYYRVEKKREGMR